MGTTRAHSTTHSKTLKDDQRGSTAVVFALSAALMIGAAGVAIDMSRAMSEHGRLQAVADIASLQAARDLGGTDGDLRQGAEAVFDLHFPSGSPAAVTRVVRNGDSVTVEAQSRVDTSLAGLLGLADVDVRVSSTSVYAVNDVDIALVLDTTGSMSGAKLDALKGAASELIDTLEDVDGDGIRLSVVPFAQHVNVGTSRRSAGWLDVPADRVTPAGSSCRMEPEVLGYTNCRDVTATGSNDGVPFTYTYEACDPQYGEEREVCRAWPEYRQTWQGCVGSRDVPLDTRAAFGGSRIPGIMGRCGTELQPLTADLESAEGTIQALRASGDTYMPSGLLWGWRTLDASAPLPNTRSATSDRVLVLMTDGRNTRSKQGDRHSGWDQTDADRKTETLCNGIKGEDITVYTVAYGVSDGATRDLLRSCASSAGNFFSATDAADLSEAFRNIADAVTDLRVSS